MNKDSISKLRTIVQDPVRFIDKCLDSSASFVEMQIKRGYLLALFVICGSMLSVIIPQQASENHSNASQGSSIESSRKNGFGALRNADAYSKTRLAPVVLVKNSSERLGNSKDSASYLRPTIAERIRRFPLMAILSLSPTSETSKVKLSFAIKSVHEFYSVPVFADEFLDAKNEPVVTYGIYINGLEATRSLWQPSLSAEARDSFFTGIIRYFTYAKDYFFSLPESKPSSVSQEAEEIDEIARDTIALIESDDETRAAMLSSMTDSSLQLTGAASSSQVAFQSTDPRDDDGLRALTPLSSSEAGSLPGSPGQRRITKLINDTRDAFVFKIDFLKTIAVRVEQ